MHVAPRLLICLLTAASLVPSASAHATYPTDDGLFSIVVGYKGEPVYTYQTTGLDLIIRDNATGGPVAGVHQTLNATLLAPGGEELTTPLEPQHGQTNRYQFTRGFVLTQPGLYRLRLAGTINGTTVDGEYAMAHVTESQTKIMFPHSDVKTLRELQQEVAALGAEHDALKSEVEARSTADAEQQEPVPSPALPLLIVLLAAVLVAMRRRR